MNFFEHQERARRHTVRLVVLFGLAVLIIVVAIDAVLLLFFGTTPQHHQSWSAGKFLSENLGLIIGAGIAIVAGIALASTFRALSLRGGGGKVATQLGGVPVKPDATDPLRRRLYNVVEEMSIAAGVPVPEVYVLEKESGINAFAAGYSTSDAAVTVTQGTLEQLDRDELQGVVAHEFSHILNGDMRLNIRLIGLLFGILVLAIVGRFVIYSGGRSRNGAAIAADRPRGDGDRLHRPVLRPLDPGLGVAPARVPRRRLRRPVHPQPGRARRGAEADRRKRGRARSCRRRPTR